jgi:DNA repair protein RadC
MKDGQVSYRISDMEATDRPRERLERVGATNLSTPELLAILLRVGIPGENAVQLGQRLLQHFGGLTGLHRAPFEELYSQKGVGRAKAAQIKAAIELGRRMSESDAEERRVIHSPQDAADLVIYEMSALEQEHLRVIQLDTRNRVVNIEEVYRGSLNSSQVRVGELFKGAVRRNLAAIIVVHNHRAPRSAIL